jgi:sigma-B regulation protein RsbU (phosphoserine phosphatase)
VTASSSAPAATVARPVSASAAVTLPCNSGAVGYARLWVSWQLDVLLPWVPVQLLDDLQLVVSELVTNALRAACASVTVTLSTDGRSVRLGVEDDAGGMPKVQRPGITETHGRGLLIVAAVSDDWGVTPTAAGKQVWTEFVVGALEAPSDGAATELREERATRTHAAALDAVLGDRTSRTVTDTLVGELLEQVRRTMHVDTAAILLLDESRQFLVATAARGIEEEVRQGVRVRAGRGFAGRIAAERRAIVLDQVTPRNVVNPLLLRRGIASMLGVPIFEGDRVLGVMHVGSLTARRFVPLDIATLERAAGRAAQVLIRHRTFVDRAGAAALLQSLTPRLPDLPGLDLAARYVPGSQYGVGGDWYDVFRLPSGLVGVAIGDVMGHGLHAATVMGRVRSALRAYALDHSDPADVLTRLDRKLQHFEPGHLATVLYGVLDVATGRVTASSAGHPPPIIVRAPGDAARVPVPLAPPIGVRSGIPRRSGVIDLSPGTVVCLYTDGMVERRTRDLDEELARLESVLSAVPLPTAEAACAQAMTEMLGDREPEDDISLLTVMLMPR